MWADKVYVPAALVAVRRSGRCGSSREALRRSVADARRTVLSPEEACGIDWFFRFRTAAGEGWTSMDPFWAGKAPLRCRLTPEGAVLFQG